MAGDADLRGEIKKRDAFASAEVEMALNLTRTADILNAPFAALFRDQGLTGAQYNVLRILRGEGRPLPCLEVASRMVTRVPDITRLVDRLEGAGLVQRERCNEDRRVVWVGITEKGRAALERLDGPVETLHRRQLQHMSPEELAILNQLLVKVRRGQADLDGGRA